MIADTWLLTRVCAGRLAWNGFRQSRRLWRTGSLTIAGLASGCAWAWAAFVGGDRLCSARVVAAPLPQRGTSMRCCRACC